MSIFNNKILTILCSDSDNSSIISFSSDDDKDDSKGKVDGKEKAQKKSDSELFEKVDAKKQLPETQRRDRSDEESEYSSDPSIEDPKDVPVVKEKLAPKQELKAKAQKMEQPKVEKEVKEKKQKKAKADEKPKEVKKSKKKQRKSSDDESSSDSDPEVKEVQAKEPERESGSEDDFVPEPVEKPSKKEKKKSKKPKDVSQSSVDKPADKIEKKKIEPKIAVTVVPENNEEDEEDKEAELVNRSQDKTYKKFLKKYDKSEEAEYLLKKTGYRIVADSDGKEVLMHAENGEYYTWSNYYH